MNEGTAIEIAECRMREMGIAKEDYFLRYRHFQLGSNAQKQIQAANELFILAAPAVGIIIRSKAGIYNLSDAGVDEQQHVHRGEIKIGNLLNEAVQLRFIQVIPKEKNAQ